MCLAGHRTAHNHVPSPNCINQAQHLALENIIAHVGGARCYPLAHLIRLTAAMKGPTHPLTAQQTRVQTPQVAHFTLLFNRNSTPRHMLEAEPPANTATYSQGQKVPWNMQQARLEPVTICSQQFLCRQRVLTGCPHSLVLFRRLGLLTALTNTTDCTAHRCAAHKHDWLESMTGQ